MQVSLQSGCRMYIAQEATMTSGQVIAHDVVAVAVFVVAKVADIVVVILLGLVSS